MTQQRYVHTKRWEEDGVHCEPDRTDRFWNLARLGLDKPPSLVNSRGAHIFLAPVLFPPAMLFPSLSGKNRLFNFSQEQ